MYITRILFLAANPAIGRSLDRGYLALDEEQRTIAERLAQTPARDQIEFISIQAARPDDWLQALNAHSFRVVHFSGHGTRQGALHHVGHDGRAQAVSFEALKATLRVLKGEICLIVLNACYSRLQAEMLSEDIECVLAMNDTIHDRAAITFMHAFYRALFTGKAIQHAFEQGKAALLLAGLPGVHVPELLVRPGADATRITLLPPAPGNTIFIACSPQDHRFLQELHTHLEYFEQQGVLAYWDTTRLEPGTKQRAETLQALASASVAILLISADFLASAAIVQDQLPLLLQAADRGEVKILSVLLRPVSSVDAQLSQFGMLNARALSTLGQAKREQFWSRLTTLVREHVQRGTPGR
ncbi:MAG TPA: CHAT domain-containing protein [Ktedonobacteraceae bacterium]|jgi:hypothetical protein